MIYKYTIKLMMRHLNEQYEDRGNILFDTLRYQTLSEKTTFMKLKNVEEELNKKEKICTITLIDKYDADNLSNDYYLVHVKCHKKDFLDVKFAIYDELKDYIECVKTNNSRLSICI